MARKNQLLIVSIILSIHFSFAGNYICYTYKGKIGKDSVSLFLQITRYYARMNSDSISVDGVLSFFKDNTPIFFSGKLSRLSNYVTISSQGRKKIEFDYSDRKQCKGIFFEGISKSKLVLQKVGEMIDTVYKGQVAPIDLLMHYSLQNAYLMGTYEKIESPYNAEMKKLKIISKSSNKVIQEIDFSSQERRPGNFKSIIFDNVEIGDYNNDGYEDIRIWNDTEKFGAMLTALYDPNKKQFILQNHLVLDSLRTKKF